MRTGLLCAALGLVVLYACGGGTDDGSGQPGDNLDGGPLADGTLEGGDSAPPPTPSPFGLDTRPPNPTCVAPPRPVLDTPLKLQRVFTGVTFSAPIYAVQPPGD